MSVLCRVYVTVQAEAEDKPSASQEKFEGSNTSERVKLEVTEKQIKNVQMGK